MKKLLPLLSLFIVASCSQPINNIENIDNSQATVSSKRHMKKSANGFTVATYDIKSFFTKNLKDNQRNSNLSNAVHNLNADIISFQEVSSVKDFKTFSDKYLADMKYNFYSSQDAGSKINSVVLSRFAVDDIKKVSGSNKYPLDNLFKMKITVNPNYSFLFYTAFIPTANTPGYTQTRRNAQIEEFKKYVLTNQKANFREPYLIVGNFNGSPSQSDMQTIIDPRSSGLSFHDIVTEDLGGGNNIFSKEENNATSRPDYILVAPGMFYDYVYDSITIHNKPEEKIYKEVSDHYPLTADFNLPAS